MTDTVLKTLNFIPGIQKNLTEYQAEGGWVECDKIRFRNGKPEKIGGWIKKNLLQVKRDTGFSSGFSTGFYHSNNGTNYGFSSGFSNGFSNYQTRNDPTALTGTARAGLIWNALDYEKYIVIASHTSLELINDSSIYDITPIEGSVTLTNAISTTQGSKYIQITDTVHGRNEGDYIYVNSQGSAVGGVALLGRYEIVEIIDGDNYLVLVKDPALETIANAGGSLDLDYLLPSGKENNEVNRGWGGGTWGTPGENDGGWGNPREGSGVSVLLRQWSLTNWGEDLIACPRHGSIYHWDKTTGPTVRAQALPGAPARNLFALVSQPTRHLISFGTNKTLDGAFDPLNIRWASQETLDDWAITPYNTAGEYKLPLGGEILGALQTRGEILIFTKTIVYTMRYIGGNDVFLIQPLGDNISTVSSHSFIDVNGTVFWMGLDGFYIYNGVIQPLPSTLEKFIFDEDGDGYLNFNQREKVYCGLIKSSNEVIWLYPKVGNSEIRNYIKYNYVENVWDYGSIDRTIWLDRGLFPYPMAVGFKIDEETTEATYFSKREGAYLYEHELGKDADGLALESFIRSAYFDIEDGENIMFVDRILPDVKLPENKAISITVLTKKYSHPQASIVEKGPYTFDDSDNQISLRARGRQMSIEFLSNSAGGDFEIGKIRLGVKPDGER